jgi:hypothetical protein
MSKQRFFFQRRGKESFKGRLQGAFSMCVSMSDKPFDAEACDIGWQASATIGLSDMRTPSKTHRVIDPLVNDLFPKCGTQKTMPQSLFFLSDEAWPRDD